jgi:hypothetical protein
VGGDARSLGGAARSRPALVPSVDPAELRAVRDARGGRRAFSKQSAIGLVTLDSMTSPTNPRPPSPQVAFRLALALTEEEFRRVFSGPPQELRRVRRSYDPSRQRVIRSFPSLPLGGDRVAEAAVTVYGEGEPRLRVAIRKGSDPFEYVVARLALADVDLAGYVVDSILAAVFGVTDSPTPTEVES